MVKTVKKTVKPAAGTARTARTSRTSRTSPAKKPAVALSARSVALAGIGAGANAVSRIAKAQDGAVKGAKSVIKRVSHEAKSAKAEATARVEAQVEAIRSKGKKMTNSTIKAAKSFAVKSGTFIRGAVIEGKKVQSQAATIAEQQAVSTAKEVEAFALKSKAALQANVAKSVDMAVANAKVGVTKLEHVFEARVAKTLNTFGVPSAHNIRSLQANMADLQKSLNQLVKSGVRG